MRLFCIQYSFEVEYMSCCAKSGITVVGDENCMVQKHEDFDEVRRATLVRIRVDVSGCLMRAQSDSSLV